MTKKSESKYTKILNKEKKIIILILESYLINSTVFMQSW